MLAYLAEQEAQNQQSFLEQIGAPPEAIQQYSQAAQFPADVLYGAYGAIPGTALSQQGAAFGQAANDLGGIFGQQLAQNASQQAAEMAHARSMAASSFGSGGDSGGLTPYQAASLEMRAMEFASEQERYGRQDELDWLKFEAELEQDEIERQQKEDQAAADSLLYMAVLNPELLNDKKFMRQLTRALGMGSSSAAGALTGAVGDARGAEADAAATAADARADRLENRRDKRNDIRSLIRSEFGGLEDTVKTKQAAVRTIMGAISTQYPGLAGWKPNQVRNMVRQHVNSQWANRPRGSQTPSGNAGDRRKFLDSVNSSISSYFDDYLGTRAEGAAGKSGAAVKYIMSSLSDRYGGRRPNGTWRNGVRDQVIKRLVVRYVMRNKGRFRASGSSSGPDLSR